MEYFFLILREAILDRICFVTHVYWDWRAWFQSTAIARTAAAFQTVGIKVKNPKHPAMTRVLKHRGEWALSARGEKELNNLDRKMPGKKFPLTGGAAPGGTGTDGQNSVVPPMPIFPLPRGQ
jgi:hypothetical protein